MFCPNLSTFAWRHHDGVPREKTNMAATGNQHWEIMPGKFVFITLGTQLIHVLIQELSRKQNLKKNHPFNVYDSSRGRHLNTASWKNKKFKGTLCQNEETSQTENLRKHKFLTALKRHVWYFFSLIASRENQLHMQRTTNISSKDFVSIDDNISTI